MAGTSRDRVTIDLRGIGDAVRAAAACRGMGVAQLVRRALEGEILAAPEAEALRIGKIVDRGGPGRRDIDDTRVRQGMLKPQARAALLASNDRLATLSTDLVALVTLLRQAKVEQARPYRDRLETADAEIRLHLDRASALIDRP